MTRGPALRLLPEGSSLLATLFGPLWLAAHGAWLAALAAAIVELLLGRACAIPQLWPVAPALLAGTVAAIGLFAQDIRRWELSLGGWREIGLVAGRGHDDALLRFHDRADAP
jgi:hypothetical protein